MGGREVPLYEKRNCPYYMGFMLLVGYGAFCIKSDPDCVPFAIEFFAACLDSMPLRYSDGVVSRDVRTSRRYRKYAPIWVVSNLTSGRRAGVRFANSGNGPDSNRARAPRRNSPSYIFQNPLASSPMFQEARKTGESVERAAVMPGFGACFAEPYCIV